MENGLQVLAQRFEDVNVEIISIDGEPYFEVYSTGMAIGQVQWNGRHDACSPRKERIDKNLESAGIMPVVRDGRQYINEEQLYDLLLEAKTDKARPFRKWVTQDVIPSIRKTGGHIDDVEKFVASYFPTADEITRVFIVQSLEENKRQRDMIQKQNEQIEEQRPAVEFAATVCKSADNILMRNMAKLMCQQHINIGEKRLYKLLRQHDVLMSDNEPYQSYIDRGYFQVKEGSYTTPYGTTILNNTTLVTPKGQIWLVGKVREWLE